MCDSCLANHIKVNECVPPAFAALRERRCGEPRVYGIAHAHTRPLPKWQSWWHGAVR